MAPHQEDLAEHPDLPAGDDPVIGSNPSRRRVPTGVAVVALLVVLVVVVVLARALLSGPAAESDASEGSSTSSHGVASALLR